MTIETEYNIGDRITHPDDGIGTVQRIEADVVMGSSPIISYHIEFESGETVAYFEFDIERTA